MLSKSLAKVYGFTSKMEDETVSVPMQVFQVSNTHRSLLVLVFGSPDGQRS